MNDFDDRAKACSDHLKQDVLILVAVMGHNCPLIQDLMRAKQLLDEAIRRGVKGKEAA